MAIFTNLKALEKKLHGLFESSALLATDVGNLYDVIVRDGSNNEIAVDNGVAISVKDYTGNGLEERYATIAGLKDKIAVIGTPAEVKTALTKEQSQAYNFTNPAGKPAKAYQIQDADVHTDIFGIASYQFTDASAKNVKVGALVTVDGKVHGLHRLTMQLLLLFLQLMVLLERFIASLLVHITQLFVFRLYRTNRLLNRKED